MTPRLNLRCADCGIRHRAVCARCDETELARLEEVKFYRSYEAGQKIVWAGDELSFVGSVVSGIATMSQTLEDGRVQMVGLLLPSDFIGRPGRDIAPYDVAAASDVTLCCFRRAPFERLLAEMPHVAGRLLEMTLDELDAAREWMMVLGRKTARERIASLLVSVARREASFDMVPRSGDLRLDLPLTREAMSEYLGLTIETVSRQISQLGREGVIALDDRRRILIPDLDRLKRETGDDAIMA
ncbi:Crp/Fnr family transcriptional regulator [Limimaricola sp. G21655-S1]|uniref:transcriptional regulator FnrL n=1 Tax=unclassified Limimaricola TaxID=2626459 RepID=UPI0022AF1F7E|nr:Crp/Fnr family transcriptional regulator [Limimaricola sp. G21655-S1]MCZ4262573.1 Crp/Fnr family transcriptional regulator [Limimaricola sp. G21655-S1]